jgi:hypothetical protein
MSERTGVRKHERVRVCLVNSQGGSSEVDRLREGEMHRTSCYLVCRGKFFGLAHGVAQ